MSSAGSWCSVNRLHKRRWPPHSIPGACFVAWAFWRSWRIPVAICASPSICSIRVLDTRSIRAVPLGVGPAGVLKVLDAQFHGRERILISWATCLPSRARRLPVPTAAAFGAFQLCYHLVVSLHQAMISSGLSHSRASLGPRLKLRNLSPSAARGRVIEPPVQSPGLAHQQQEYVEVEQGAHKLYYVSPAYLVRCGIKDLDQVCRAAVLIRWGNIGGFICYIIDRFVEHHRAEALSCKDSHRRRMRLSFHRFRNRKGAEEASNCPSGVGRG